MPKPLPVLFCLLPLLFAACATDPANRMIDEAGADEGQGVVSDVADVPRTFADGAAASDLRLARTAQIRAILGRLSLRQRIAQRFITWIDSTSMGTEAELLVGEEGVGGVILYPRNLQDRDQVVQLCRDLQQTAVAQDPSIGLFITVDQEGGRVAAIRLPEVTRFPSPFALSRYDDPRVYEAAAYVTATEIRSLGFNMNLAPVLDLSAEGDSGVIGDRAMGDDPVRVGVFGQAYLDGMRRASVIAVIKHAPGHGSTTTDSHGRLPVVDLTAEELLRTHFVPFRMAIDYGAEAIMTAHILFPKIDPDLPVTLSPRMIEEGLRGMIGFDGVVISDGMAMGALAGNYSASESLGMMFNAGVDIVLVHSTYDVKVLIEETMQLLAASRISEKQITQGTERILRLKADYGLVAGIPPARRAVPPAGAKGAGM